MNHRIGRVAFALIVGSIVAVSSYRWITDPGGREERELQVRVVEVSRGHLRDQVGIESLEIVDTLAPNRVAGKAYVFPEGDGWSVSGYYRRDDNDGWHPFLMSLRPDLTLVSLKVQDRDSELLGRANASDQLEVVD